MGLPIPWQISLCKPRTFAQVDSFDLLMGRVLQMVWGSPAVSAEVETARIRWRMARARNFPCLNAF